MVLLCLKNKYDAIYVREMEKNPGPRLCSKLFHLRLYIEINDLLLPALLDHSSPTTLIRKVKHCQELDFQQAAGLIVPSVTMREWIVRQYDLSEDKVHMILNGTDSLPTNEHDRINAKKNIGLPPNCFCLGFIGTIYDRYDFDSMLNATLICQKNIPQLYFAVIGDGPFLDEVKKKVTELGLAKQTVFTGYIQPDKLGKILPAADIGLSILNKKYSLRYGPVTTKLSTYAAYHLSVVTTGFSLEGYPDQLAHGLHLVAPEDPNALADTIIWLHDNTEKRQHKAKILHDFVSEKLTWNHVTKEILEIVKTDTIIT
jgi:glycosyltransferase involved in cell wall biosynthesis